VSRVSGRYGRHFCGCSLETPGFGGPDSLDGSKLGSSISFNYHHAEIADGIAKARREGVRRKAADLAGWLEAVLHLYGNRVLPFDVAAARVAGTLSDRARSKGQSPGFPDLAIAATAVTHQLAVLTGNLRHFAPLGVAAYNPLDALPKD
jgi:predicted nucleic acid-binding protein